MRRAPSQELHVFERKMKGGQRGSGRVDRMFLQQKQGEGRERRIERRKDEIETKIRNIKKNGRRKRRKRGNRKAVLGLCSFHSRLCNPRTLAIKINDTF